MAEAMNDYILSVVNMILEQKKQDLQLLAMALDEILETKDKLDE